ncbi:hypothetical protein RRG58_06205 [Mycoplasmopsis cynos]|nr:hypothetical protein [Mycoplasmopsis felis]WQQ11260.1 hypothetical protein RRG50_02305 [Mycoplasmopsis felis]
MYLKEINPDYEKIIKRIITKYDERVNVTYLKTEIFDALKYGETGTKNIFSWVSELKTKFLIFLEPIYVYIYRNFYFLF